MMRSMCCVLAIAFVGCTIDVRAAQIEYSWSGMIKRSNLADPTDPWVLGVAGKPFQISVVVDQAATDVDPTVNSAQFFNYNAITFAINGTPASSLSNNPSFDYFGFTDNVFGLLDQIVVGFTAQFNGFSTDLGAAVRLPLTTFAFSLPADSPPLFGTTTTEELAGFHHGDNLYYGESDKGILVTSKLVPEPRDAVLITLAFIMWTWRIPQRRGLVAYVHGK
jgi:hypothetical protein